jgi:hypothetical protein
MVLRKRDEKQSTFISLFPAPLVSTQIERASAASAAIDFRQVIYGLHEGSQHSSSRQRPLKNDSTVADATLRFLACSSPRL